MRQLVTVICALFMVSAVAQETTFKKFYKTHKEKSAFSLNLSASFAGSFLSDDDNEDLQKLLKKSGDFKLMVFNNEDASVSKDFKRYIRKYKLKTMVRFKGDDGKASFYILKKNDIVKEIILKANSDDDKLVLFGLKTNLTTDELAEMMSNSNINITTD
ncbi:DUF4252 domain-containing protein [Polaribacter aquimarinus]|uniref:DUF4252 domain-containing protein n=1 Tax=Polaribacter aquimarinus TaxID=2100726 RepID=A0A2U2JCS9_9FLAO|nr:DUF4252 domain-containing protein [Polaribacter aquimarinus]PWG06146.1 DUF4252 domain-containing protein [Polaribacter aquimarinus]